MRCYCWSSERRGKVCRTYCLPAKLFLKVATCRGLTGTAVCHNASITRWVIPAVLAIPTFAILANLAAYLAGQEDQLQLIKPGPADLGLGVLPVMVIHFTASLVTSPLFEEPGWRGFALPRLQARFGRFAGSLVVGVLWWLWHQPMNLTFGLAPTLHSALSMIALSFMIDSLFNLSGKNVFVAMLAHQSYGTVFTFLVQRNQSWLELGLRIAFVVVLRVLERSRKTPDELPHLTHQETSG